MHYITTEYNKCNKNGMCSENKLSLLDQAVMYAVMKLVKAMSIHHERQGLEHRETLTRGTKDITGNSRFVSECPS